MSGKRQQQQQQHPLLGNPGLMEQLRSEPTYPENHTDSRAELSSSRRRLVRQPRNWFKRPAANPLAGQRFFPTFDRLPCDDDYDEDFYEGNNFRKFWILLAEITDDSLAGIKFFRNEVKARDKAGKIFPICFYPESDSGPFNYKELRAGSTLVLFCPTQHMFLDGRVGLRMEQLECLRVLPLSLASVLRCAELLHACSVHRCWHCKQARRPLLRCTGCGYARYCGPHCQMLDFARHRPECAAGGCCVRQVARLVYFWYAGAVQLQARENVFVAHPFDLYCGGTAT